MMKRKIYKWNTIALLAGMALLAGACADTDTTGEATLAVQFTPQLKNHQAATRAAGTSWTADDKVGIYMVPNRSGFSANAPFGQYQVSGAGTSVGLVPVTAGQTLYYPANGDNVNFIAFSPYAEPTGNKVTYSGFANQSDQTLMEAVDALYSNEEEAFNRTSGSASLTFSHVMSKLVVKVTTADAESEQIDLTKLDITVTGLPASASLNLSNGEVEAASTKTDVQLLHTDDTDERIATAIVAPHNGMSGRSIIFKDDENTFSFSIPSTHAFASGKVYTMEFVATKQGVVLTEARSYDWLGEYVAWDDEYVLSVDKTTKYVPANSLTNIIELKTNNKRVAPTVTYSTSATNATAGNPDGVTFSLDQVKKTDKTEYMLYAIPFDVATPSADRFYAHITLGKLKTVVEIKIVQKSANCIVLQTEGRPALIPVKIANEAATYQGVSAGRADGYTAPFATSGDIEFDAKVLWVDAPSFTAASGRVATAATDIIAEVGAVCSDLANSYLYVKPGTKEGNAVVCITKPGTDEIIWSWHIWVVSPTDRATMWISGSTENTLSSKPAATANGYTFFPLHLGAFNALGSTAFSGNDGWSGHPFAGLYYQWGRKDPITNRAQPSWMGSSFPTSGLPYISNVTGFVANTTADYTGLKSIQNPHVFNWSYDTTTGWQGTIHLTGVTNNSWGYASSKYGSKSPFDPCPAGWRVPPGYNSSEDIGVSAWKDASSGKGTWTTATNATYGIAGYPFTNYGGFHPAAGNRNGSASFNGGGSYGYYWSAGPSASNVERGYGMYFYSSSLHAGNGDGSRRSGFSVRCVAE